MRLLANSHESLTHPTTLLSKVKPAEVEPYTCIFPVAPGSSSITSSPPAVCDFSPPTAHPCGPVAGRCWLTRLPVSLEGSSQQNHLILLWGSSLLPSPPPRSPPYYTESTQPALTKVPGTVRGWLKHPLNVSGLTGPPLQPFRAGHQTISPFHPRKGRDNRHKGHFWNVMLYLFSRLFLGISFLSLPSITLFSPLWFFSLWFSFSEPSLV